MRSTSTGNASSRKPTGVAFTTSVAPSSAESTEDTTSTDASKRDASARARSMLRLYSRTRAEPHRSTAASTAAALPPAPRSATRADCRASPRSARAIASTAADVGVVADERRRPSRQNVFTAPQRSRQRRSAVAHSAATASLCGIVTLPHAFCRAQRRQRRGERVGGDVERFVDERDAGGAQCGVLEARRERVRDRMPEQDQASGNDSRCAGDALRGEPVEDAPDSRSRARPRSRGRRRALHPWDR